MKYILYIDDDMFIRDLVTAKLNTEKYQTIAVPTAKEGLAAVAAHKPDLVLLDLELPDMSGLDVLKSIKTGSEANSVPVIIFSNNDDGKLRDAVMQAGAVAFYTKMIMSMDELRTEIEQYLWELSTRTCVVKKQKRYNALNEYTGAKYGIVFSY